jgi:hypothetical protein
MLTFIFRFKYPLAVLSKLIDSFGADLMVGYDIGCGISTTVSGGALLGPKAASSNLRLCVGSFHGHAHKRECQLRWHPMYIKGSGLEDYETCERVFSQSNALARTTRLASRFHRHQLMRIYFDMWNEDKYAELSKFSPPFAHFCPLMNV